MLGILPELIQPQEPRSSLVHGEWVTRKNMKTIAVPLEKSLVAW